MYTDWLAHGLWQVWSPTATTPSPTTCRRPRSCAPICYIFDARTPTELAILVLTASLSTRGCNPTHKRLQRVRMRVSDYNSTPRPMRAPCVPRAPCYHYAITTRRCVMALVTAATWPVRAATGKNALTKKKKK